MKNLIKTVVLLTLVVSLTACFHRGVRGSGIVDEDIRKLDDFTSLDISGAFEVEVKFGNENKIDIIAEDNILPLVVTKISGDRLIIKTKRNISNREEIKIKITAKKLNSLDCSGANTIDIYDLVSETFDLNMSGANTLEINGKAENISYDISGACTLRAKDFEGKKVKIDISGASNAKIFAKDRVYGDVSGVCNVDVFGDPSDFDLDYDIPSSVERR